MSCCWSSSSSTTRASSLLVRAYVSRKRWLSASMRVRCSAMYPPSLASVAAARSRIVLLLEMSKSFTLHPPAARQSASTAAATMEMRRFMYLFDLLLNETEEDVLDDGHGGLYVGAGDARLVIGQEVAHGEAVVGLRRRGGRGVEVQVVLHRLAPQRDLVAGGVTGIRIKEEIAAVEELYGRLELVPPINFPSTQV